MSGGDSPQLRCAMFVTSLKGFERPRSCRRLHRRNEPRSEAQSHLGGLMDGFRNIVSLERMKPISRGKSAHWQSSGRCCGSGKPRIGNNCHFIEVWNGLGQRSELPFDFSPAKKKSSVGTSSEQAADDDLYICRSFQ